MFNVGYVALIIDSDGEAELYSPEGQCNYKLAPAPVSQVNPVFVFASNKIVPCGGEASCWEYNLKNDSWLKFTQATYKTEDQPGVVHDGKLYIIVDSYQAHVLDIMSNTWSMWPMPPNKFGNAHWMVGWKDSIILLGGDSYPRSAQIFNITSQTWTAESTRNVQMDLAWSSSLVLGQDEILVVGSSYPSFSHSATRYYPQTDAWLKLPETQVNHLGSRLVKLGSRIFAIDGYETDTVEEFFAANNTWSLIGIKPINSYQGHQSLVSLPAALFAHLPGGCKGVF